MVENIRLRSRESIEKIYLRFMNKTKRKANVVWIDYEGVPKKYCTLDPDQFVDVNTFVSHPWIFEDDRTGDKLAVHNNFVFYPSNWAEVIRQQVPNAPANVTPCRIIVPIRIPVYSLRNRCLQVVRDNINRDLIANLDELQLPKSVNDDLNIMLYRKLTIT